MKSSPEFEGTAPTDGGGHKVADPGCCPFYHEAVELVGRRWTGAILRVLMDRPMRFSEVVQAVPELSDRLLSARMKELEARGIVERYHGPAGGRPGKPVGSSLVALGSDGEASVQAALTSATNSPTWPG